jgi:hypothetical protein
MVIIAMALALGFEMLANRSAWETEPEPELNYVLHATPSGVVKWYQRIGGQDED